MTENQLSPVWVVIPAAGVGQRMKAGQPKQYLKIHNKTLIEHTLNCFIGHEHVAGIVVVLNARDKYWHSLNIESALINSVTPVFTVEGGENRSDSVIKGLKYLSQVKEIPLGSWVMVHDAARPCLSNVDLSSILAVREMGCIGGLLASPVRDTMKRTEGIIDGTTGTDSLVVSHTESRENLWHALTPQIFRLGDLEKALSDSQNKGFDITDECSAMEFTGENPVIVECVDNNIKVTHPNDMALASFLLGKNNKVKK